MICMASVGAYAASREAAMFTLSGEFAAFDMSKGLVAVLVVTAIVAANMGGYIPWPRWPRR